MAQIPVPVPISTAFYHTSAESMILFTAINLDILRNRRKKQCTIQNQCQDVMAMFISSHLTRPSQVCSLDIHRLILLLVVCSPAIIQHLTATLSRQHTSTGHFLYRDDKTSH